MTPDKTTTLWLGAFRYYCGRMTYAVSDFCEMLQAAGLAAERKSQQLVGSLEEL